MARSAYEQSLKRLLTSESTPKLGLDRIKSLLDTLGNPERDFDVFHIAGTNGKGSTCAFLASLLAKSVATVGLYTSPHLSCARERIQINRSLIEEDLFCDAEEAIFGAAEKSGEHPSFFERMTAMAFWAFSQKKIDVAVIEVGIGGRLDATNVVLPKVSAISRIDLDHTEILGDAIETVAFEKAGIIKPGVPVVTGWQDDEALKVIRTVARNHGAPLKIVSTPYEYNLAMQGPHQKNNAAIAIEATRTAGVFLTEKDIQDALLDATWPGRLELICGDPPLILDGAHNAAGVRSLVVALQEKQWSELPIVFVIGGTKGHNLEEMAQALWPLSSRIAAIVLTKSRSHRAISAEELEPLFKPLARCIVTQNVGAALSESRRIAVNGSLSVVCGSLFVVGEMRGFFADSPCDPEFPLY